MQLDPPNMDNMGYENVTNRALQISRSEWMDEATNKPKLRTYVKVKDFDSPICLVKTGMSHCQRSLTAQLLCDILPLELEVSRYLGTNKRCRYCKVCGTRRVEYEVHFLFDCPCPHLRETRKGITDILPVRDRKRNKNVCLHMLLSPMNIKKFSIELKRMYIARQKWLYK